MSKPKRPTSSSLSPCSSTLSPSKFSHTAIKRAVAQILKSTGFKYSKSSALETLTRVTTLFLQHLSKTASSHATFSCRHNHCNVFDIIHAIEDSSLPFGFPGASNTNQTLSQSKTLCDLDNFVDSIDVLPSLSRIRDFGSSSPAIFSGKVDLSRNNSRGPEIPRWLPVFPEIREVEDVKMNDEKVLWESRRYECHPSISDNVVKGKKEILLQGRRERVKFKLVGKKRNTNLCSLDDLELPNEVCKGGKRVCLIKRVDSFSRFFKQNNDEELICNNEL